jgi:hypothetical protein
MKNKFLLLRTNEKNLNGRIYPDDVVKEAVLKPEFQARLKSGRVYGTLGQSFNSLEEASRIDMSNVSHVLTDITFEGNNVFGEIQTLDTPAGRDMEKLLSQNTQVELALRAVGDGSYNVKDEAFLVESLDIISFDWVLNSSTRKKEE